MIEWQLPVQWHYAPGTGRAQLEVHHTSAMVAGGRVVGKASLSWDTSPRVEGNLRFSGVDLQTLLRQLIGPTQFGGGQMTGQFDFSGSDVHSVNDLSSNLVALLSQAQAASRCPSCARSPRTSAWVRAPPFSAATCAAGSIVACSAYSSSPWKEATCRLHVEGTVSLEGRLNLNVTAKTGEPGVPTGLRALALRIPIVGSVPQIVLKEASSLLANRVVDLEVTGTVHSPVLRLRPLPLLSDEAVRFFLNRSNLPIPLAE